MRIEEVRGRIPTTTSRKLKYGGVAIKTRNKSLTLTKIDFFHLTMHRKVLAGL